MSSLLPRLFLIEERAWQHWGVVAIYFRYVMIQLIYSDPAHLICEGTCGSFQTVVEKDREKQHKLLEE